MCQTNPAQFDKKRQLEAQSWNTIITDLIIVTYIRTAAHRKERLSFGTNWRPRKEKMLFYLRFLKDGQVSESDEDSSDNEYVVEEDSSVQH